MESLLDVVKVINLSATTSLIYHRIRTNAGGDRAGRSDDDKESIRKKLDLFYDRTNPLIDYYKKRNTKTKTIDISKYTTLSEVWNVLENEKQSN